MTVLSPQEALALALDHHGRGHLAEAQAIYRMILQQQPQHAGALHLLGVALHQSGDHASAAQLIQRALAVDPQPDFYSNLGEVWRALQRPDDAITAYQHAIALRPNFAEAHSNLANVYRARRQFEPALAHYRQAIALKPDFILAHSNLARTLAEMGRYDEAVELFRQIVQRHPQSAEAHTDLGNALTQQQHLEEAVGVYRQAIELDTNCASAWCNVSNALTELDRYDEAVACCRRALELIPSLSVAWCNMGNALTFLNRLDEAVAACRQSIALDGNSPEAWNNLGVALQKQDHLEEAVDAYRRVLELSPGFVRAMNNLGEALKNLGRVTEATAACGRAAQADPLYAEAHWNHALCLLVSGDLQQGFAEYEWRFRWKLYPAVNGPFAQPQWDGSPLRGRTILLHAEQGLGDTIQFIRYVPLVAAQGGKIVVQCPPSLAPLLRGLPGIARLVEFGEPLGDFDVHSPMLSLPHALGTTLQTIPAHVPYLSAPAPLQAAWKKRLPAGARGIRVGLAWAGKRTHKNDRNRSIALERLAPLAAVPGVTFFSLQLGDGAQDAVPAGLKLVDLTAHIHNFADTAALLAHLDLVICVDTSVAHLAGALAKPTWTLLPFAPDWRWLLERTDTPWYPTMRLFRQPQRGAWDPVIAQVAAELKAFQPAPQKRKPPKKR